MLCAKVAAAATLSNFINMPPLMATAISTANVKAAKREVLCEVANILISPISGHCGPLKRMYFRWKGNAPGMRQTAAGSDILGKYRDERKEQSTISCRLVTQRAHKDRTFVADQACPSVGSLILGDVRWGM